MTAKLCLKPGFARRTETYEATITACGEQQADVALNRLAIDKALALGTGETLTPPERSVMMALLAHLDVQGVAADATSVWPGAGRLCALLGIAESTLRRLKGSLEAKGFLLRRYDRRNRPLKDGAIDLKPFLLQVPALLEEIGKTERDIRKARDDTGHERTDVEPNLSARVPDLEPPKGNTQEQISEAASDLEADERKTLAEQLDPAMTVDASARAAEILGEKTGPRLLAWAERSRGPGEARLGLALAGSDPSIRNPRAWFGWMATTAMPLDLESKARALLKAKNKPAVFPPKERAEENSSVLALRQALGQETVDSYVAKAQSVDGSLRVEARTRVAAARLSGPLRERIDQAVEALALNDVVIEVMPPRRQ